MPALKNPRHEAFAQALARGVSASAAYGQVGFKPHRANAATLARKEHISVWWMAEHSARVRSRLGCPQGAARYADAIKPKITRPAPYNRKPRKTPKNIALF